MIKAVIFDWGGVIAPNPNGGWLNVLAEQLRLPFEDVRIHWHAAGYEDLSKGLISERTFWEQFEDSIGEPVHIDKTRVWSEGSALVPWRDVLTYINSLRDKGIKTAVLSNTIKYLSSALREDGQYEKFDAVVLSDEVGVAKPNPKIYQIMIDRLNIQATNCIYIDDIQKNLQPAIEMGMKTILAADNSKDIISSIQSMIEQNF